MYVELAKNGVSDRGYIVDVKDYVDRINTAIASKGELYRSYYQYDEEILEHISIRKTVRNYRGKYYLDRILFDIDKGADNEEGVLRRTKMFIDKLYDEWKIDEDLMQIWYSGRGFHITTPDFFGFTPSNILPIEVSATMNKYFPEADNIYDGARIIRAEYSWNEKGKAWKIPIALEDMFVENINNLTKVSTLGTILNLHAIPSTSIANKEYIIKQKEEPKIEFDEPSRVVTCVQRIFNEGELEGSRHKKLLRLASSWMRTGRSKQEAYILGKAWASTLETYEVQRIVDDVYSKKYRYSCSDEILAKKDDSGRYVYCDSRCIHYIKRDYTPVEVTNAKTMEEKFREFVRTDFEGKVLNLRHVLKLKQDFLIYPKELVVLMGDSGTNKSTILQNILIGIDMPSLMIVTENSEELTYRRAVQIKYGLTKQQVEEHYKHNDNTYSTGLMHMHHYCGKPRLDAIKRLIAQYEPKILAIDVLEDLIVDAKGAHERLGEIGDGLKTIANETGLFVIAVHHLSKYGATDEKSGKPKELNVHSGKGNSVIEQKADKVIGIQGKQDAIHRTIRALKARDENPFNTAGYINMNTMRYISNEV